MPATIKSQITTAIMQALAKQPSPQNRIKTVRPNNDYTAQVTLFRKTTLTSFTRLNKLTLEANETRNQCNVSPPIST